ncbi:MAG: GAF domain-containing protein [Anaerolineae bacterium]|nr:GAF domain-containing protein [Anaerolineae bacterium]
MAKLSVLVAANRDNVDRYRQYLKAQQEDIRVVTVTSAEHVHEILASSDFSFDVMVADAMLGDVPQLLKDVQSEYHDLLTILVDEGADFAMPGRAHDVSTDPFNRDDLIKRIKRLVEERRLETLRADALPPVRSFARQIRKAAPGESKREAAVGAVQQLGFDYAGFFSVDWTEPAQFTTVAQVGPPPIARAMPVTQPVEKSQLLGWVAHTGESKVIGPDDTPNYPLVADGTFASAAAVPVGINLRFGVILACRQQPNAISGQDVMMLELVAAQLAAALAAETRERKKG